MTARHRIAVGVPGVGFVLEQTLGHITWTENLQRFVARDARVDARFRPVSYEMTEAQARVPGFRNWTVRAGLRARRAIHDLRRDGRLDTLFIHTQVPTILSPDHLSRTPAVISLDATPIQFDALGLHYQHKRANRVTEHLKWRANRACFARAKRIVAWSQWTKSGVVDHYGLSADKVTVIPPGVDTAQWAGPSAEQRRARRDEGPVRLLFVGGDFVRKGGFDVIAATRRLRGRGNALELDLVTNFDVPPEPGVRVHRGLSPNSAPLVRLFREADVFCLPTKADCLGMALLEAGAMGLPLVSCSVGGFDEIVRPGQTGVLVPPESPDQLAAGLEPLVRDDRLRRRLGEGARSLICAQYDATVNAERIVDLLLDIVRR